MKPTSTVLAEALFQPQHLIELRAIKGNKAQRRWVAAREFAGTLPWLQALDRVGWDVFYGVNPRLGERSTENAIAEVVAFHVDFDQQGEPNLDSVPAPSAIVDSGHGRHLYWIVEPVISVSDENRELLKAINRGLAQVIGGDQACCDLGRILRLPGFSNHKPPTAPVRLLCVRNPNFPADLFHRFAAFRSQAQVPIYILEPEPLTPGLKAKFEAARTTDRSRDIGHAWRGEIGDGSSDSRYMLVKSLRDHGFSQQETIAVVCSRSWYNRHTEKLKSDPRTLAADAQRVWAKLSEAEGEVRAIAR